MNKSDLISLLPFIIVALDAVLVMLAIAFFRSHRFTALLSLVGLALAVVSLPIVADLTPRMATPLLVIDSFALYYMGLIFIASFAVAMVSYSYLEKRIGHHEEYYVLLLAATLGTAVLSASSHFASFFLGIEILSVSLYALAGYQRHDDRSIEAGVKYLILAAVSSAFILFGMALVYAEIGSMEFAQIAARAQTSEVHTLSFMAGIVLIIVGLGFKLAVVPFHLWTPDVYQGAPAPVTAFIATVSKGGVFALVLRLFSRISLSERHELFIIFAVIAIASMFTGNLLALMQNNVKRILAYSSISHLGYLLVTLLASQPLNLIAASFYLAAYFVTTLGAFGVISVLSTGDRDADRMDDYRGLAWRRPWIGGILTAMLFSLAGIPLTAGFIAKFYVVTTGVGSALWILVIALVVNSALGLYYYLRIVVAVYSHPQEELIARQTLSLSSGAVLTCLTIVLVWFGVYPGPVLQLIQKMMRSLL